MKDAEYMDIPEIKTITRLPGDFLAHMDGLKLDRSETDNNSRKLECFTLESERICKPWVYSLEPVKPPPESIKLPAGTQLISITDIANNTDHPVIYAIPTIRVANTNSYEHLIAILCDTAYDVIDTLTFQPYHLIISVPDNDQDKHIQYYECRDRKALISQLTTVLKNIEDEFEVFIVKGQRCHLGVQNPSIAFDDQVLDLTTSRTIKLLDLGLKGA